MRGCIPRHQPPLRRLGWLISIHDARKFFLEVCAVLLSQSLLLVVLEILMILVTMWSQVIWLVEFSQMMLKSLGHSRWDIGLALAHLQVEVDVATYVLVPAGEA